MTSRDFSNNYFSLFSFRLISGVALSAANFILLADVLIRSILVFNGLVYHIGMTSLIFCNSTWSYSSICARDKLCRSQFCLCFSIYCLNIDYRTFLNTNALYVTKSSIISKFENLIALSTEYLAYLIRVIAYLTYYYLLAFLCGDCIFDCSVPIGPTTLLIIWSLSKKYFILYLILMRILLHIYLVAKC